MASQSTPSGSEKPIHGKAGTLTLDSAQLYVSALSSLSSQTVPLNPSTSLSPIPSNFPQHKHIPKTRFVVDFFRFSPSSAMFATAFFLSHFHSDHYAGLSSSWSSGIVFCSNITARLLNDVMQVPSGFVFSLPLEETVVIDGCEVALIDANHCPGAVQFLFKVPLENGGSEVYVHTGDFRYCHSMRLNPILSGFVGCDAVFLDTTYCNPKFVFPTQEESVDYVVGVIEKNGGPFNGSQKDVLFLVATYVIGKEKILLEIARRCERKIFVDSRKMTILRALGYGDSGVFTEDESDSDVHVVGWNVLGDTWPYFRPNFVRMNEIKAEKGYGKIVGFVPTGWTYEVKRNKFAVRSKDSFEIHLVPYSEHSNYNELREYVKFLRPKRVIPTVGLDAEKIDGGSHLNKMLKHFSGLVDEMANKKEFLMGFFRGSSQSNETTGVHAGSCEYEGLRWGNDVNSLVSEDHEEDVLMGTLDGSPLGQEYYPGDSPRAMDDVENEKFMLELRDFLPSWVTRDQMQDMIRRSGRNTVEIVTNFCDREVEFYEEVFVSSCGNSESQVSLPQNTVSLLQSSPVKETVHENPEVQKSQVCNTESIKSLMKTSISPGKRKKNSDLKLSKKVKVGRKPDPSGPKQSTITKFFNKTLPGSTDSQQCLIDKTMVARDPTEMYKDEIDQFIMIVNGDESLRSYAAYILDTTKGDVNGALDTYYRNPDSNLREDTEGKAASSKSFQVAFEEKHVSEVPKSVVNSLLSRTTEVGDKTLVSLPPEEYKPVEHACWNIGQAAPYIHLARTFELVESEKGKIKATSMLCNMFRSLLALSPEDVLPAVYLCTNKIAPDHENIELNIGGSLITSAMEEACGTSRSNMRDMYNKLGDLGDVAQLCRQNQKLLAPPACLLIKDVLSTLRKISLQSGNGSMTRKKGLIVSLMCSCREKEIKFLVRTLVRNLRIGAMMRTVLPALAQAVAMNSFYDPNIGGVSENLKDKLQSLSVAVVEAYNIVPTLDLVVPSLMEKGIEFSASTLSMVPGIPIKPMLAKITNGVPQALKLFQNRAFTCEYKYDGQRAQIHKLQDGSIRIFSRNGDETTSKFPDLIDIINRSSKHTVGTFILDAEVVAVDRNNGCRLMSFQELSTRERGSKDSLVTLDRIKVDICVFVFDIMFANGEQLEKFVSWREIGLHRVEAEDACLTNEETLKKISGFLEEAFQSSCEGIMVKSLDVDAGYFPSKRADTWLKVKRDYLEGLNDSLDLVPIGAWHGNGRKAGWYSPFLMACFNPETEEFQSVCRVMSGFLDSFYKEMKEFFSEDKILIKKPPYYRTAEVPDMWFSPELVWEIKGADFTISPVHHAGIGLIHPSRGISIRFPRFIRSVNDRNPEQCSTSADIAELFHAQTRKMGVARQH